MTKIDGSIKLPSSSGNVFNFVTNPKNFPAYIPTYSNGFILSGNATGVGSAYKWRGNMWFWKFNAYEEVIEWEDGKKVKYAGSIFNVGFISSMEVSKVDNGETELKVEIEYNPDTIFMGKILDVLFLKRYMRKQIDLSLEELKKIFG